MRRLLLRTVGQWIPTLLAVSVIIFVLSRLTGDPLGTLLPLEATNEQRARLSAQLGLDQPLYEQYGRYLGLMLTGDFGLSQKTHTPALDLVLSRLGNSLGLAGVAMFFALIIGIPLGVVAAVNRGRAWDSAALTFALFGQSIPAFFSGIVAILLFSTLLKLLPTYGASTWQSYVLPGLTLGWAVAAGLTRLIRSAMIGALSTNYVAFARAKGMSPRQVIWKHAFRNTLVSIVTYIGYIWSILIGSAVSTEVVFGFPGLGRLAFDAVAWRDFPTLQAVVMVSAILILTGNLVVELVYGLLDPRVRM